MSELMPDYNVAGSTRVNKRLVILGAGALTCILIGGVVYGLTDTGPDRSNPNTKNYNAELPPSREQERIESLPSTYEIAPPVKPEEPEESPPPLPDPPPLVPQPAQLSPSIPDPMAEAARQSAIAFFNKADPRQTQVALGSMAALPGAQPPPPSPTMPVSPSVPGGPPQATPNASAPLPPSTRSDIANPFLSNASLADASSANAAAQRAATNPTTTVFPGTVIKARLDTAIDTTHPSVARARVVETVFDHLQGRSVLIPQGTTLIGTPTSNTRYGQERIFIAWTQATFPDGESIELSGMSAADSAGRGGIPANVDNHYLELFATAALSSIVSVGSAVAGGNPSDPLTLQQRAAEGLATSVSDTGSTLIDRAATIPPTLTAEPGMMITIIVNRPITLEPQ